MARDSQSSRSDSHYRALRQEFLKAMVVTLAFGFILGYIAGVLLS